MSRGYQGAVYKVRAGPEFPGTEYLVVKDAMGSGPARALRRRMIRREYAVYRRLDGVRGVPRCFGLRDERLLPTYRRAGIELSSSTLCGWVA
ncbi:MAG: hypothetical protein ACE5G3_11450, partial [Gammaproteobacteria bacterium]